MAQSILIIEDSVNDLIFYRKLFFLGKDISFLFYNKNKDYTEEKFIELSEVLYEDMFNEMKGKFFYTKETIENFLKNNLFDFYIIDSLEGQAKEIVLDVNLPKEKVSFLSSTSSFRRQMQDYGYKAYSKKDIEKLIKENLAK